ncbi:MAG: hypothetical protein ACE5JE_05925 [Thermoplasmata archaeon]
MKDRSIALIAAISFAVVLVSKMILLEPLTLSGFGLSVVVVAALLPLALLLGSPGILIITVACGVAHWVNDGVVADAVIAAVAVGVATFVAYLAVHRNRSPLRWIAAGWILTALFVAVMTLGTFLVFGHEPVTVLTTVLARVWIAINLVGIPVAILASHVTRRVGPVRPASASGPQGAFRE